MESFDFYPCNISIHALLAESDNRQLDAGVKARISIHALLAESDSIHNTIADQLFKFLSTLSLRRATSKGYNQKSLSEISIHALLAESDL